MTIEELEAQLRKARRDVFSDDPVVADAASLEIKRLRKLIEDYPVEIDRRNKLKQAQDEQLMRRWA